MYCSAGSRPRAAKSGMRTKVTEAAFSVEAEVVELEAGVVPLVMRSGDGSRVVGFHSFNMLEAAPSPNADTCIGCGHSPSLPAATTRTSRD